MAVFLNDKFLDDRDALLHVSDLSMQRGYAVFDFFRTVRDVPLFMEEHLKRFYSSAAGMHLPLRLSTAEISSVITELINRSSLPEAGIRLMLTGGYSDTGYHPVEPNLLITCNPVKTAMVADFERGLSIITHEHQRELPQVKTINYLMAVWLQPLLLQNQADDVLYYNKGMISEFPRSNVFIVTNDNRLKTPASNILLGVTRKNILSIGREIMATEETNIFLDELMAATEVFLTSTTKRILPVVRINNIVIGDGSPGKTTRLLYQRFLELEKSKTHLVSR